MNDKTTATTAGFTAPAEAPSAHAALLPPKQIGRYRVERLLGKGGFGLVFLAYDDQLSRSVAIKVPHPRLVANARDAESYLAEARTVANLDHPNIVPVHDVGGTKEIPCYVVAKYIDGTDLAHRIRQTRLPIEESVQLVATVAEALHHAHKQGLVHRDVKPGNILLDKNNKPFVADFGLALREQDIGKGPCYAGTPAYMSPEQARGEGHRVDARCDIFSLGVVFYELLLGRRPFKGETEEDLLEQIANQEPRPPRQYDDNIPRELERICLRALAKRASERYSTAKDMADDLRHYLVATATHTPAAAASAASAAHGAPPSAPYEVTVSLATPSERRKGFDSASLSHPVKVVPKGLRSFDEHDADFFLELLPGPRDREGLPDNIRFWKTRIEEADADKTFPVGLIYGPSGCGKSSQVKAGLLPRLSERVIVVYLEATPDETELRLLNGLRKRCPALPDNLDLKKSVAVLRRGQDLPLGRKVLIVLDQFEQWLHSKAGEPESELVEALRQCDGGHVQCVVMVRDDFWMAATRFMRQLEVSLIEGRNSASVDLFPLRHAEKVLTSFGRAFGSLPENDREMSPDQRQFIKQAVGGLAQDGKVICVRLALFSEMMKGRPWTTATLKEVGGAEGIGVTFLEETFAAASAPPDHRYHQAAARAVLKALLPESGSDIKGHMRSRDELLSASGYAGRPKDFDGLLRILDGEVRLIVPTDPEGAAAGDDSTSARKPGQKYYQLSHDYLVPSLRDWLTRKQKETRRGRAELRLADRTAIWNTREENRHLPSMSEYLSILALTRRNHWTEPQRRMMGAARRVYGLWGSACCLFLIAAGAGGVAAQKHLLESGNRTNANTLVKQLLVADLAELPRLIEPIEEEALWTFTPLVVVADDPERPPSERLRATFALADRPGARASQLIDFASSTDLRTLTAIRTRLAPYCARMKGELWRAMRRETASVSARLRIATLLAVADPDGHDWASVAPSVVQGMLDETTLDLEGWVDLLSPAAPALVPNLRHRFFDQLSTPAHRIAAARVLAHYADARLLGELLLSADAQQFSMLLPGASRNESGVVNAIHQRLEINADTSTNNDPIIKASRLRNAAAAFLRLGHADRAEPLLTASADPTGRTEAIFEMREFGVPPDILLQALEKWRDPSARQALLLALEPYRGRELPATAERELTAKLVVLLRDGLNQSERSAAAWLLGRWGQDAIVAEATRELVRTGPRSSDSLGKRDWWITGQGQTMALIHGTITFTMGSPEEEVGREQDEKLTETTITHSFGLSICEVTMEQYRRFRANVKLAWPDVDPQWPANNISFDDAVQYCRWLSEQEGVPEDQMCYPAVPQADDAVLPEQRLRRTGYRLPTEEEWEYACRSGATTPWFSGIDEKQLGHFAWFALNARERVQHVGLLRPNALGFFDTSGNVGEWCHGSPSDGQYPLRGGAYNQLATSVRSARRYSQSNRGYSYTGFRISRTITP